MAINLSAVASCGAPTEIRKPTGTLIVETHAKLEIEDHGRPRIFNLVPGFEAVPVFAEIPHDGTLTCRIRMQA